jgi:hypothetical protein
MEGPGPYMSMVSPKKREVNQVNFHFKNDGQLIILSIFLGLLQDDLIWEFKMFRWSEPKKLNFLSYKLRLFIEKK